jgi:PmbA protein
VPTQIVPVVWSTEVAWSWLELVAEAAAGDARYRGTSFLIGREGERIASPLVTITDDGTLPGRIGSRPFDAEGVVSRRTPVVTGGTFAGFLHDTYSGRKSGQESTANAIRLNVQGVSVAPRVGPSNLVMAAGDHTPVAIIGGVKRGLYVTDTMGFGVNLSTGDFSRGAAGLWIEDGELTYPVSEVNIAGNILEMMASIDAVGDDVTVLDAIAAPTFRMARATVSGR